MHDRTASLRFVAIVALIASCGDNARIVPSDAMVPSDVAVDAHADAPPDALQCLQCDSSADVSCIGDLCFNRVGGDEAARRLITNCGFQIFNRHNGGVGDTLEIATCISDNLDPGIVLVWAFNSFTGYRVCRPNFTGSFSEPGFDIGCRIVGNHFRP
jgi:hypothetical protein